MTHQIGTLLRATLRVDRPRVPSATARRNALGVAVPLALGLAMGQVLIGLTLAIGALNVAFSDHSDPYPLRARRMLLASLAGALAAFVGSSTASIGWLAVVLAMIWGFGGGLLVALGPDWGQVGLVSIVLLIVFSGRPLPLNQAAITGALVFLGGAFQTLLAVTAWPFRPYGPECGALADVYRSLAAYTHAPSDTNLSPPLAAETTAAQTMLAGVGKSAAGETLRSLLDEAERIRLVIIALDEARQTLGREHPDSSIAALVTRVWLSAGEILGEIAESIATRHTSPRAVEQIRCLDATVRVKRPAIANPVEEEALILMEALAAQLSAAVETTGRLSLLGGRVPGGSALRLRSTFDLRDPMATLRANLTLRSPSFRHAVRLAVGLGIADALARGLGLPRGYWVPMTVALVLKPDFSATFVRGTLRVGGTLLGLVVATALVLLVPGNAAVEVVFVAVLVFAIRRLADQNYGLAVVCITALVVILFSLLGISPEATIVDRGVDTLVGGLLALVVYAVWPTWERTRKAAILADLLDAYRQYFDAVLTGYLNPRHLDAMCLRTLRLAARLARTNAEASIERLRGEPGRSEADLDRAVAFLAATNRFARASMALEAQLYAQPPLPADSILQTFVDDVDATLQSLSHCLRDPIRPLARLPNLREDVRALASDLSAQLARSNGSPESHARLVAFLDEAERIVDSLEAMAQVIRHGGTPAQGGQRVPAAD